MSQFVSEAHISWLWCFCSRFNRAEVSFPIPPRLPSSWWRCGDGGKQEKLFRWPRKWKQQNSLSSTSVCVSVFVGKCQVEGRSYQSYNRFLIESPKKKHIAKSRLPFLTMSAIKKKTYARFRWWWIAIHSSLILIVVPASSRLLFINYARSRRRRELSCLLSSLLLRVVLVAPTRSSEHVKRFITSRTAINIQTSAKKQKRDWKVSRETAISWRARHWSTQKAWLITFRSGNADGTSSQQKLVVFAFNFKHQSALLTL